MKRTFSDLSQEDVAGILNTAMDDGEWHTPSANDIRIKEQNNSVVYGWCNISKHNTYHDKEVWFNINANTVQIWVKEYQGQHKIHKSLYRPIFNLKQLGNVLSDLKYEPPVIPAPSGQ